MPITISDDVFEKLSSSVGFDSDEAKQAFVIDALNAYVRLGRLAKAGNKIFVGPNQNETTILKLNEALGGSSG